MNIRWNLKTIFLISFLLITILITILRAFYYGQYNVTERMHPIAVFEYKISAFFGSKIPIPQFAVFIELPRESLLIKESLTTLSLPTRYTVKPQTRFKVGEEIFFRPVLINLTPKPVTIFQRSGYFSVDVQDEWGKSIPRYPYPQIDFLTAWYFTLKSGERITSGTHRPWGDGRPIQWRENIGWDPAKYPVEDGGFKLVFDQPGRYQITAYAYFIPYDMTSFKPKPLTLEEWQIHAIPVWIKVDP